MWKIVGLLGAALNVVGALLLVVVISPRRSRYQGMVGDYDGGNPGLERYLNDQVRAGALVLVGTTLQLLAAVFT
jgi:hypothetical protein